MNNLSWFIYLTQLVDNIGGASIALVIVLAFAGIPLAIFWCIFASEAGIDSTKHDSEEKQVALLFRRLTKSWIVAIFFFLTVSVVIPSRQTMLLIAGSEIGERIVKSDAVKDIVNPGADLLKAWIKDETDKITSKKK